MKEVGSNLLVRWQIISLESVCARWGLGSQDSSTAVASGGGTGGGAPGGGAVGCVGPGGAPDVRALAFSVFSGARRLLQHHANGKSLTGFGTAADSNLFLQNKDVSTHTCTVALTLSHSFKPLHVLNRHKNHK